MRKSVYVLIVMSLLLVMGCRHSQESAPAPSEAVVEQEQTAELIGALNQAEVEEVILGSAPNRTFRLSYFLTNGSEEISIAQVYIAEIDGQVRAVEVVLQAINIQATLMRRSKYDTPILVKRAETIYLKQPLSDDRSNGLFALASYYVDQHSKLESLIDEQRRLIMQGCVPLPREWYYPIPAGLDQKAPRDRLPLDQF